MPLYLFQGAFTSDAWAAQIKNPKNRADQVRPMIEAAGGKLLGYYYAFGEYDVVVLIEAPDNVSVAALAVAVASGGALKAQQTTVLMTPEEGLEAMRRASGTGYRPPGH